MWWQIIPSFAVYSGIFVGGCVASHLVRRLFWEKDGGRHWDFLYHDRLYYLRDHAKNGTIYKAVGLEALED